jgi:hypothetical protein
MKSRRTSAGAIHVAPLLFSCACGVDISYTPSNAPPHSMAARAPDAVEVHRLPPSDRPFVETGVLDETGYWGGGTDNADRLLRQRAGQIGCDAIVIEGYVQHGARYRAICIVYKE